jgi:hypothetical protein
MTLIKTIGRTKAGNLIAILDTPCFPCRYYAGKVYMTREGFVPADNATNNFHRTIEEATEWGKVILRAYDDSAISV